MPWLAGVFALAYLLGSVPFGLVITKLFRLGDLRSIGSGNIGATNVLRTGSKPAALATLILDGGKGAVAVLIAFHFLGSSAAQIAGLGAFLGHIFPVWLRFRGGKGVATFIGIVLALDFPAGLAVCATWLAAAVVSRRSSVGALAASALSPVWLYVLGYPGAVWLAVVLAVLIWLRHKTNIARLVAGREPRIGRE
ncbi:MAG: glycerol-3-phosphate 1-O-acyltransferase PlsY [Paracoccaceae bacterium]